MVEWTGQGPEHGRPARDAAPPRMRRNGQPAAAYAWHVAPGGILFVVDLYCDGWRFVTNDAGGMCMTLPSCGPTCWPACR